MGQNSAPGILPRPRRMNPGRSGASPGSGSLSPLVVAHPDIAHRGGAQDHTSHDHLVPHLHLPPGGVLYRELYDLGLDLLRHLVGDGYGDGGGRAVPPGLRSGRPA